MLTATRRYILALKNSELASAIKDIASLRNELTRLRILRETDAKQLSELRSRLSLATEGVVERENQVLDLKRELADAAASADELRGQLMAEQDRVRAAEEREKAAQDRIASLLENLAGVQHELDMSNKQLEIACKENELLAKIHMGDLARRDRELAVENRGKTEAESAARFAQAEGSEDAMVSS